ncbi:MAG: hypothetical protein QOF33_1725 [Thermomicrobiales bacterium]|jgi:hypothetical protein|nr:hypothetical protein [Thermomicrobiales bacterium]
MAITFELWDVDTGNIIGSFATQDESLEAVRRLLEAYGPGYAEDLDLTAREDTGTARNVASGDRLIALSGHSTGRAVRAVTHA